MSFKVRVDFAGLCAFVAKRTPRDTVGEMKVFVLDAGQITGLELPAHLPRFIADARLSDDEADDIISLPGGQQLCVWNVTG